MKKTQCLIVATIVAIACVTAAGQCGGNGGYGRLETTRLVLGTTARLTLSGAPGQPYALFISDGPGPTFVPGIGFACLDLSSPVFGLVATGSLSLFPITLSFPIPNDPGLLTALAFIQAGVGDGLLATGIAITNAIRVDFEVADSFTNGPSLSSPRALAAAARAGNGLVLVTGGGGGTIFAPQASSSTDLYDPVLRTVSPGPALASARALHTATALETGQVLICGGVDNAGLVTAGCETFDPLTATFLATPPMGTPRAGHTAILLDNGRVLVAGGTTSFAGPTLAAILNAAVDTGEVYDPATNSWTPVSNVMASKRFGAAALSGPLTADTRSVVISGISGATSVLGQEIPQFTPTQSIYNRLSNAFTAGSGMAANDARAFHGASRAQTLEVWVTGGLTAGSFPAFTASTLIGGFNGWGNGPSLPQPVAMPGQVTLPDGSILLFGGITGDVATQPFSAVPDCVRYSLGTVTARTPLPAARGNALVVPLLDGSILLAGGAGASGTALDTCVIHMP